MGKHGKLFPKRVSSKEIYAQFPSRPTYNTNVGMFDSMEAFRRRHW